MLGLYEQIRKGYLICPKTRQRFQWHENQTSLVTEDGKNVYQLLEGKIPVFLIGDEENIEQYKSSEMHKKYAKEDKKEAVLDL